MKHKIMAIDPAAFNALFDNIIRRLEQVGEKIVKVKFNNDVSEGYRATVWTEHESKEAK